MGRVRLDLFDQSVREFLRVLFASFTLDRFGFDRGLADHVVDDAGYFFLEQRLDTDGVHHCLQVVDQTGFDLIFVDLLLGLVLLNPERVVGTQDDLVCLADEVQFLAVWQEVGNSELLFLSVITVITLCEVFHVFGKYNVGLLAVFDVFLFRSTNDSLSGEVGVLGVQFDQFVKVSTPVHRGLATVFLAEPFHGIQSESFSAVDKPR